MHFVHTEQFPKHSMTIEHTSVYLKGHKSWTLIFSALTRVSYKSPTERGISVVTEMFQEWIIVLVEQLCNLKNH